MMPRPQISSQIVWRQFQYIALNRIIVKPKLIMATIILIILILVVMTRMWVVGSLSAFSLNKLFLLVGSAMYSWRTISAAPYMAIISISLLFSPNGSSYLDEAPPPMPPGMPLLPDLLLRMSKLCALLNALSPSDFWLRRAVNFEELECYDCLLGSYILFY